MANTHVAARSAAINPIPNDNCERAVSAPPRLSDQMSMLLTALIVATAQQRAREAAAHERLLKRHADDAWQAVLNAAHRIIETAPKNNEDRAFIALALVTARFVHTRGTTPGYHFHRELMDDPSDMLGLFRHARSQRSARLMASAFSAFDRLSDLRAFGAPPQGPEANSSLIAAA